MYSLPFDEHLRRHRGADFACVQKGVAGGIPGIVPVGRIRVVVQDQDVLEGDCAGGLQVDGRELNAASQFVGIRRNQFAHQPVLDFGGLHGYHCRCQQQYYESEDPDGYVIVPFRVRAIIVIYKNKK